jgi:predicted SAM-dependent methyltransferase
MSNMGDGKYIQYGCGWSAPPEWRNFDASPTLRFERLPVLGALFTKNKSRFPENVEYGDIVGGLPVAYKSCDGVYCSHVLEHLSLEDFRVALRNTRQLLRSGGTFRLVVPDLEYLVHQYLDSRDQDAAMDLMRESGLGFERRAHGIKEVVISILGNSRHLWMWDYKSLERELLDAGFVEIRRAAFGDSADSMFSLVEVESRWLHCLGVECKKAA